MLHACVHGVMHIRAQRACAHFVLCACVCGVCTMCFARSVLCVECGFGGMPCFVCAWCAGECSLCAGVCSLYPGACALYLKSEPPTCGSNLAQRIQRQTSDVPVMLWGGGGQTIGQSDNQTVGWTDNRRWIDRSTDRQEEKRQPE